MRLLQLKNDSLRLEKSHCENLQNTEKRSEKEMQPLVDKFPSKIACATAGNLL